MDKRNIGELAKSLRTKLRESTIDLDHIKRTLEILINTKLSPDEQHKQPYRDFEEECSGVITPKTYGSFEEFCTGYLSFTSEQIKHLLADDVKSLDLIDKANQRGSGGNNNPAGCKGKGINVDNIHVDSGEPERPTGTSKEATLRRLRKDYPELHGQVIAGEISPNAAAIQAGFRQRTVSIKLNPESAAQTITKHFSNDDIKELIGRLNMAVEALSA